MIKRLTILFAALALVGCGGEEGYSDEECRKSAQDIAAAKENLATIDRSTTFGEYSYQLSKDNIETWEIAYRGLCG